MSLYTLPAAILIPIAGVSALLFISDSNGYLLHQVAFYTSLVTFVVSIFL
jgi:hypothetical protein